MESNIIKMQGNDGKEYALTLSFAKLYKLEKARPEEAQRYFENCGHFDIQNKSEIENELEIIRVIYTAYLCAHLDEDNVMSYEEFLEIVPTNRNTIGTIYATLLFPKN